MIHDSNEHTQKTESSEVQARLACFSQLGHSNDSFKFSKIPEWAQ